jgi:tetrapyrrole methylase family protein/MazG family protein
LQFERKDKYSLEDLLKIMDILRSPEGCPWDREQTHKSIRNNLIEETYEAVEAIDTENPKLLEEELGDVLFQVVFHAQLEKEAGRFDFSRVVDGVTKKMIQRHPHVFGSVQVSGSDEVLKNWDTIKQKTKGRDTLANVLESVSPALPALMRSQKVWKKAAQAESNAKSRREIASGMVEMLQRAECLPDSAEEEEKKRLVGSLLFSAAALSEDLGIESEEALAQYCESFVQSYREKEE